jgi:hypothetical protein
MPEKNPIDRMATELADWAMITSKQIADSIKGGFLAPAAAQLSERQKLEYYTAMMFEPDGSPNEKGRAQLLQRMGPVQFAEAFADVTAAHPELAPKEPEPYVPGYRGPDGLPGTDIAPDGLPKDNAPVAEPRQSVPMPTGPIAPDGLPTRVG